MGSAEKTCTLCGQLKPLDAFYVDKRKTDGRSSACKECSRNRARRWRKTNPEGVKEQKRRYSSSEAGKAAAKARRERNPEATKASKAASYQRNREAIRARQKEYNARPETKELRRRHAKAWDGKNPGVAAARSRLRLYGLTAEQYDAMVLESEGRCASCNDPADLHVDHNHETGIARGLLCPGCNFGIGLFRENPDFIERAIEYLARSNG